MTSELMSSTDEQPIRANSAWRFLTPTVCRLIFIALMLFGAVMHIRYLNHNCPLGLSEDEAHYWDWSRQLGLSYYSKGPLVAYLIHASCAIFGNTMPAVRYPAILLSLCSGLLTYWLIVKLFSSDRLALGSALLSMTIPVFVAGSMLMTIDSPFYFFWALATCLAAKAIFDNRKWPWPLAGVAMGLGFLAKYTMFVWPLCLIPFFIVDRPARRHLRSAWFWSFLPIALAFTTPVIIFNAQHHWVTVYHVHADTIAGFSWGNLPAFLLGQAAILGFSIFFILVGAIAYVFRQGRADPNRRALAYLTSI
ncbi:MAG TPA: glycosyltransferase family 39 protein, partial [Tepidisphaeraceae bacterium]|nr:glycosyltransferase family 39 protein [Tepidisphaeraceae bacterium]